MTLALDDAYRPLARVGSARPAPQRAMRSHGVNAAQRLARGRRARRPRCRRAGAASSPPSGRPVRSAAVRRRQVRGEHRDAGRRRSRPASPCWSSRVGSWPPPPLPCSCSCGRASSSRSRRPRSAGASTPSPSGWRTSATSSAVRTSTCRKHSTAPPCGRRGRSPSSWSGSPSGSVTTCPFDEALLGAGRRPRSPDVRHGDRRHAVRPRTRIGIRALRHVRGAGGDGQGRAHRPRPDRSPAGPLRVLDASHAGDPRRPHRLPLGCLRRHAGRVPHTSRPGVPHRPDRYLGDGAVVAASALALRAVRSLPRLRRRVGQRRGAERHDAPAARARSIGRPPCSRRGASCGP